MSKHRTIKLILIGISLVLLLILPASAKNLRWPEMRGKQIIAFDWNCTRTRSFPKRALSKIAHNAIPADYRSDLGNWADRAFAMDLTDDSGTVYFVPLVCWATGNCSWRLYTTNPVKYLGQLDAEYIYTYENSDGWPTIITYTHMNASEGDLWTYNFRNGKYRLVGEPYHVSYQEWGRRPMPRFLNNAREMCRDYGK